MIPLSTPFFNGNEWKYVKKCIDTAWVSTAGGYVQRFEDEICKYTGAKFAISCVNGTSGLFISLKLAGVTAGDEVIVPTLTFIAPINTVKYLNAEPIFIDCDDYMNIDTQKIEEFCKEQCVLTKGGLKNKKSGKIIKAILPVHIFGNPCDMRSIVAISKKYNLKIVEDATESLGSCYCDGNYKNMHTGTIGDFGVFSFNGNKIITTGGGGMIVTNNEKMATLAKYLTTQAKDDSLNYIHNEIGYNFRLNNIQAALGIAQLEQLNSFIKTKKRNYAIYNTEISSIKGLKLLGIPKNTSPNYWFYSLLVHKNEYGLDKNTLINRLAEAKIETRPVWYLNNLQKPYLKNQSYKIEKAEYFLKTVINLPCSSNLSKKDIFNVVNKIRTIGEFSHGTN